MHENWRFHHVAVVVKDMNKAVEYYSSFDIGPFVPLEEKVTILGRKMHGQSADDIKNIIRLTQVGRVQIELISLLAQDLSLRNL